MTDQELKTKRTEFLNETIAFYNSGNRCVDDKDNCQYHIEGKAGCAIGRHIEDKELCRIFDKRSSSVNSSIVFGSLPPSLSVLGSTFLYRMQRLHDEEENWNENGLTLEGKECTQLIRKEFGLDK